MTENINSTEKIYRKIVLEPWFSLIESGKKMIEGRLNVLEWKEVKVGDTIIFNNGKTDDEIKEVVVCVVKRTEYNTFGTMLVFEGIVNVLPHESVKSLSDGINIYRNFYTTEKEQLNGVVAIHFHLKNKKIKG